MLSPRRVAFINEKGGCAKTTLVANVGAYLAAQRGRRVLAIDFDPQGQLGKVLGVDVRASNRSSIELLLDTLLGGDPGLDGAANAGASDPAAVLPILRTRTPGLDLIVSNKSLALHPTWEPGEDGDPTGRLLRSLNRAPEIDSYDFVLFDAPPSFGPLTLNVLRASTEVVVPVPLTYLALDGCAELVRTITTVQTRYDHPELRISMVVPTFYRRTRLAHEILERLKLRFPKQIAQCVIGYHVKIDEAQSRGLTIFEYAPNDRGARVMAEVAEELELRGHSAEHEGAPS